MACIESSRCTGQSENVQIPMALQSRHNIVSGTETAQMGLSSHEGTVIITTDGENPKIRTMTVLNKESGRGGPYKRHLFPPSLPVYNGGSSYPYSNRESPSTFVSTIPLKQEEHVSKNPVEVPKPVECTDKKESDTKLGKSKRCCSAPKVRSETNGAKKIDQRVRSISFRIMGFSCGAHPSDVNEGARLSFSELTDSTSFFTTSNELSCNSMESVAEGHPDQASSQHPHKKSTRTLEFTNEQFCQTTNNREEEEKISLFSEQNLVVDMKESNPTILMGSKGNKESNLLKRKIVKAFLKKKFHPITNNGKEEEIPLLNGHNLVVDVKESNLSVQMSSKYNKESNMLKERPVKAITKERSRPTINNGEEQEEISPLNGHNLLVDMKESNPTILMRSNCNKESNLLKERTVKAFTQERFHPAINNGEEQEDISLFSEQNLGLDMKESNNPTILMRSKCNKERNLLKPWYDRCRKKEVALGREEQRTEILQKEDSNENGKDIKLHNLQKREESSEIREWINKKGSTEELERLTTELEGRIISLEKEKGAIQDRLEREVERREKEWAAKLERMKREERRLKDRTCQIAEEKVALEKEVLKLTKDNKSLLDERIKLVHALKLEEKDKQLSLLKLREEMREMREDEATSSVYSASSQCCQLGSSSTEEIQQDTKEETLLCRVLREKLFLKEVELEQLKEEFVTLRHSRDWLQMEVDSLHIALTSSNQKCRDLDKQLLGMEEATRALQINSEMKSRELIALHEQLPRVRKQRDQVNKEAEEMAKVVFKFNAEVDLLRKRVEKLEEDVMLKDGQISILQGAFYEMDDI